MVIVDDRGQTFTLEAFIAAIVLVGALAFALHAVAITSNTASGADAELRNQHVGVAEGVFAEAAASGALQESVLAWNESTQAFHEADHDDGHYVEGLPESLRLGDTLNEVYQDRQTRYTITLYFENQTGETQQQILVDSGSPTDEAVRVVETVTVYNDTPLVNVTGEERNVTVGEVDDRFYTEDVDEERSVHSVIRVEVILWRA